jgi:hypothetical protein
MNAKSKPSTRSKTAKWQHRREIVLSAIRLQQQLAAHALAREAVDRKDLESAVPIICRTFTPGMAMREDVQSLRQKLIAAARCRGILPLSLKVRFRNNMSVLFNLTSRALGYIILAPRPVGPGQPQSRVISQDDRVRKTGIFRQCRHHHRQCQVP